MIKNIIFDLDGTLINTLQEDLDKNCLIKMRQKFYSDGLDGNLLMPIIINGIEIIAKNNGEKTNEEAFWEYVTQNSNISIEKLKTSLEQFYQEDYNQLNGYVKRVEIMQKAVQLLKEKGYNLILATNPYFPATAIEKRMIWGNINPQDFSYISSYENSSYTKPNTKYYEEIITKNNLKTSETIMFGNDLICDLSIEKIKIPCFIITNHMCNIHEIEKCKLKGDYEQFFYYIQNLPNIC